MMRAVAGLRFIWLLALRDLLRAPRRSVLLAAVIAVPLLALSASVTVLATTALSPQEQARYGFGNANVRLTHGPEIPDPPPLPGELRRVSEAVARGAVLDQAGARHALDIRDLPAADPLVRGVLQISEGRSPERAGEAAASRALLTDQGVGVGGFITLDRPATRYVVVGVVLNPAGVRGRQLLLPPGEAGRLDPGLTPDRRHYIQGPDLQPSGLQAGGVLGLNRSEVASNRAPRLPVRDKAFAVALTLLTTAVVSAAALGVTARGHGREVAVLVANGAPPKLVAARLVLYALPVCVIGAAVGAGAGVVLGAFLVPLAARLSSFLVSGLTVPVVTVVAVAFLSVLSGLAAALLIAVLAGRRRPRAALAAPVSGRPAAIRAAGVGITLLVASSVAEPVGGLAAATALSGTVIGTVLLAPLALRLLSVAATPWPLAWRAGLRDAARHADRSSPAIAALVVTVTCAIAGASYLLTDDAAKRAAYVPQLAANQAVVRTLTAEGPVPPVAAAAIADVLPARDLRPLLVAQVGSGSEAPLAYVSTQAGSSPLASLYLGDQQTLSVFGGNAQPDAFLAGQVIVLNDALAQDGRTAISWSQGTTAGFETREQPAAVVPAADTVSGPQTIMDVTAARQLGLEPRQQGFVMGLERPPSTAELTRAEQTLELFPGLELVRELGYESDASRQVIVLVSTAMLLALVTALAVAALATHELAPFLHALRSIGATTTTARLVAGLQAAASSLTGSVLGAGAGLLAASRLGPAQTEGLTVPWQALALFVLALPVLTGLFAAATTSSAGSARLR